MHILYLVLYFLFLVVFLSFKHLTIKNALFVVLIAYVYCLFYYFRGICLWRSLQCLSDYTFFDFSPLIWISSSLPRLLWERLFQHWIDLLISERRTLSLKVVIAWVNLEDLNILIIICNSCMVDLSHCHVLKAINAEIWIIFDYRSHRLWFFLICRQ